MTNPLPLLVFTDLDGTLLAHDSYAWDAALPALSALKDIGAGVVLASSKTAPEMYKLRNDLGLERWPAIVENGAGRLAPGLRTAPKRETYHSLRRKLGTLPANLRAHFRGFGDMDAAEIARITGLPLASAHLAATRAASEPGLWSGTQAERNEFIAALAVLSITAREGGRFLTLSFGGTKADQMSAITDALNPARTVALGDAPNDIEMLETADFGAIVANPHRAPLPPLRGEAQGQIIRTDQPGPIGWNTAILSLLNRLNLT
jgi:mannosyl-3-phosphoglycerate phosphatase